MKDAWIQILREHTNRYPLMEPQDYGKLIFQSEFGVEHMIADEESVYSSLCRELEEMEGDRDSSPKAPEDIGGALRRFPLSACASKEAVGLLARLFLLTAQTRGVQNAKGLPAALEEKIKRVIQIGIPGMEAWAETWMGQGCPAIHHSDIYRDAYHPHYRLLKKEYAGYFPALLETLRIAEKGMTEIGSAGGRSVIIAIDGSCGSGKTSFAGLVGRLFPCNVFHMDDYYLPLGSRPENWRSIPGGNMDLGRFRQDVLLPAKAGKEVVCRPYNCQKGVMEEERLFKPALLTVVEGSYSHHPLLAGNYDLKIFFTCPKQKQESRLKAREGSHFPAFEKHWIPMEENYFKHFAIEEGSDLLVDTGSFF